MSACLPSWPALPLVACLALAGLFLSACDAGPEPEVDGLPGEGRLFGRTVALSGGTALVGATASNEAFIFTETASGWRRVARLSPDATSARDPEFGWSVALDGDVAVVGAPHLSVDGSEGPGQAYVYERGAAGWARTAVLQPEWLVGPAHFGWSVGVSQGIVVVGAPGHTTDGVEAGAVAIFNRGSGGWEESGRIVAPGDLYEGPFGARAGFGRAVAVSHGLIAVSSAEPGAGVPGTAGLIRVFERGPGGTGWSETAVLSAPGPQEGDAFGSALALDVAPDGSATLAAAALGRDYPEPAIAVGALFLFLRAPGAAWAMEAEVPSPGLTPEERADGVNFPGFAYSVAVSGDRAMTGGSYKRNHGVAYAYARRPDGTWALDAEVVRSGARQGELFGEAVALDGSRALIGAPGARRERGAAFVFERGASGWVQTP